METNFILYKFYLFSFLDDFTFCKLSKTECGVEQRAEREEKIMAKQICHNELCCKEENCWLILIHCVFYTFAYTKDFIFPAKKLKESGEEKKFLAYLASSFSSYVCRRKYYSCL